MDDAAAGLYEAATYCKPNDDKRPELVGLPDFTTQQICPDDVSKGADEVTDAFPQGWYARIMFDELLDSNVEDLVPIKDSDGNDTGTYSGTLANTQPVTLECQSSAGGTLGAMVEIPYDGYYSPSGNAITWPLGPSLVIAPLDPTLVATNAECQITLKDNITDKDGNKVPDDQRGPFKFKIAPVQVLAIAPSDGDAVDPIAAGVDLTFNTDIDPSSLVPTTTYDFTPSVLNQGVAPETGSEYFLYGDFEANGDYTWAFKDGATIKDQCGIPTTVAAADATVEFTTNAIALTGIAPFDGQMDAAPADHVKLAFNQYMDPSTLAAAEYTLAPAVAGAAPTIGADGSLEIAGPFSPGTDYTFTLKAGATIDDCPGGEQGACVKSAMGGTFTNTDDQTVHFHTADIMLTGTSPADNDTVTKPTASSDTEIDLTFNQDMDPASLDAADYTISPSVTLTPGTDPGNVLTLTGALPAGQYTFTLKGTATLTDVLGNAFSPGQDVVIHFTVEDGSSTPPTPCF